MSILELLRKEAVYEAHDGEQALARVQETLPDLILLDIMMPKIDGLQVLQRLRKVSARLWPGFSAAPCARWQAARMALISLRLFWSSMRLWPWLTDIRERAKKRELDCAPYTTFCRFHASCGTRLWRYMWNILSTPSPTRPTKIR